MVKNSAQIVQAMPLEEGKTNLADGQYKVNNLIHCVTEGYIDVIWSTGTTDTIDMLAGQDFAFTGIIDIATGKYHIS